MRNKFKQQKNIRNCAEEIVLIGLDILNQMPVICYVG